MITSVMAIASVVFQDWKTYQTYYMEEKMQRLCHNDERNAWTWKYSWDNPEYKGKYTLDCRGLVILLRILVRFKVLELLN